MMNPEIIFITIFRQESADRLLGLVHGPWICSYNYVYVLLTDNTEEINEKLKI